MKIQTRDRASKLWVLRTCVCFLTLFILYPGAARSVPQDQPPHITVHQGQLSVDLQAAAVGEVLAKIAQQAHIIIRTSLSAEKHVSAQFTDMALEAGLRRLLQHASLSYAMHYARGASGGVILTEVRVFEAGKGAAPHPESIVKPDAQESTAEVDRPVAATSTQTLRTFPRSPSIEESPAVQQFTEMLDRARQDMPAAETREEGEVARSFREALEYVQQLHQTP